MKANTTNTIRDMICEGEYTKVFTIAPASSVLISIASLSPHGFKLSNGDEVPAQRQEIVDFFTLVREKKTMYLAAGMPINQTRMVISDDQMEVLQALRLKVDLLIAPFRCCSR